MFALFVLVRCPCVSFVGWLVGFVCVSFVFTIVIECHVFSNVLLGPLGGVLGVYWGLLAASWGFLGALGNSSNVVNIQKGKFTRSFAETSVTQYIIASLVSYRGILIWSLGVAGTVDGPWWFLLAASRFLLGRNLAAKRVQGRC